MASQHAIEHILEVIPQIYEHADTSLELSSQESKLIPKSAQVGGFRAFRWHNIVVFERHPLKKLIFYWWCSKISRTLADWFNRICMKEVEQYDDPRTDNKLLFSKQTDFL